MKNDGGIVRSHGLQTYLTNQGILVLGVANAILLARWLLPEGRGEVAAALLWPMLLVHVASIGLYEATVYYVAREPGLTSAVATNALYLTAVQAAIVVPLGYVVMPWLLASQPEHVVGACRLLLIAVPLSMIAQHCQSILRAHQRMDVVNLLRMIVPVGYLAGTVLLISWGRLDVWHVVSLHLMLTGLLFLACLFAFGWHCLPIGYAPDYRLAREMLRYGGKVYVGALSQGANMRADQVLIAAFLGPVALGYYVVAVGVAAINLSLGRAMQLVLTPRIAAIPDDVTGVQHLWRSFRHYWIAAVVLTIPLAIVAIIAIPVVYGNAFRLAIWPAVILVVAALFAGARDVMSGGARALGDPWLGSRGELAALGVTLALLALLLPAFGIAGAAIASLGASLVALAVVIAGLHARHALPLRGLFALDVTDLRSAIVRQRKARSSLARMRETP